MAESNNYFSGSFESLFAYWQKEERARRFTQGGTRERMIHNVIEDLKEQLTTGIWIDIGTGAGYIQNITAQIHELKGLTVGLDMSIAMLHQYLNTEVQRVAGIFQALPFRKLCADNVSSFFCLSDYPNLHEIFTAFTNLLTLQGKLIYVDYASGDQYWETRKKSKHLVGNINLRKPEEIQTVFTKISDLQTLMTTTNRYTVNAEILQKRLPELPNTIVREFLYCKAERISVIISTKKSGEEPIR